MRLLPYTPKHSAYLFSDLFCYFAIEKTHNNTLLNDTCSSVSNNVVRY